MLLWRRWTLLRSKLWMPQIYVFLYYFFSTLFITRTMYFHWFTFVYISDFLRVLSRVTCLSCQWFHWFSLFHMYFSLLLFIFLLLFETFEIQQYQITNVAFCSPMLLFSSLHFLNILWLMTVTNKPQLYSLAYPYAAHILLQILHVLCLKS